MWFETFICLQLLVYFIFNFIPKIHFNTKEWIFWFTICIINGIISNIIDKIYKEINFLKAEIEILKQK